MWLVSVFVDGRSHALKYSWRGALRHGELTTHTNWPPQNAHARIKQNLNTYSLTHSERVSESGLAAPRQMLGIDDVWGTGRAPFSRLLIDPLNLKRASHLRPLFFALPSIMCVVPFSAASQLAAIYLHAELPTSIFCSKWRAKRFIFALAPTLIRPGFFSLSLFAHGGRFDWGKSELSA